ncbi:MAG: hypothetical protein COB20_08525 [SAR86 cluster bacterium]|uniref:Uncharacterized protein n=1 Tax=SAR86 cluster bacterium TaxID=2030880 RepID=A0A2A4X5D4_9GAMM|nr:MAG: hypothetical protein COB20_08525 [SAR86 cluster bacterium]
MSEDVSIVLIVAIVFAFIGFRVYLKYRTEQLRSGAGQLSTSLQDENVALKAKALELEDRIQVLESIVTNKNFRLEEEINSLS